MSKNRIKIKLPQISTREEAAKVVGEIAELVNRKVGINSKIAARTIAVKKEFEDELATLDEAIEAKTAGLRTWSENSPEEYGKAKSIKFLQGVIGFRTGQPRLALLNRKWTWDKVLEAVKTLMPAFVRHNPEINKDALIDSREDAMVKEMLPNVGLKVVQDEGFYVEPDLAQIETRQTATVAKAA